MSNIYRDCARCHRNRPHKGRGLCDSCHTTTAKTGHLNDYPRINWPNTELLNEYAHLQAAGVHIDEAARRLGISRNGLKKAIERATKKQAA